MAIKSITRAEFDVLMPTRPVLEGFTGRQVAWFTNDANDLLGAIDQDRTQRTWSYVVLEKDGQGKYRVREMKAGIENRTFAEDRLLQAMKEKNTK